MLYKMKQTWCYEKKRMMDLNQIEKQNLLSFRAWSDWLIENTPAEFNNSLSSKQSNILIHLLEHFEKNSGSTMNLYTNGALIVTIDQDDFIIEKFKSIIEHRINKVYITTTKGKTPKGIQNLIIAHVEFYDHKNKNTPTGFSNKNKEKKVYSEVTNNKNFKDLKVSEFQEIVSNFDQYFLNSAKEKFIAKNVILHMRCLKDINVKGEIQEGHHFKGLTCIALAHRQSTKTGFIMNLLNVLKFHNTKLVQAQSIYIANDFHDENVLTHFYLDSSKDKDLVKRNHSRVIESLSMVQWFEFENPLNTDYIDLGFSIHHSLFLRSLEEFIFQMLNNVDENLYNTNQIHDAFTHHSAVAKSLVSYFSQRFNPIFWQKNQQAKHRQEAIRLIERLDTGITKINECRKNILNMGVLFIDHVLKTNYYVIRRSALSYRVDPNIIKYIPNPNIKDIFPEIPYGIFFIKGKNFIAFNIRFRNLSRGGVRTFVSLDPQQMKHEIKGVFKECYNLAYTQQKKNKDIPEGGSKSVIFIKPYIGMNRDIALEHNALSEEMNLTKGRSKQDLSQLLEDKRNISVRKQLFEAQQSFCDTLLDLLIWNPKTDSLVDNIIKDYYGKEELIFLGPDENMTDQMIEWISSRSYQKNYKVGMSFMSGKKQAGINHKEYGVTSLGVHQYLLKALEKQGLLKGKSFSVKISGGPDGDVAGNEIVNLINSFGSKVLIQCVIDGSGILYDPKGISHAELLRLFKETKGVSAIHSSNLHEGSFVIHIRKKREVRKGIVEVLSRNCKRSKVKEAWINASEANNIYHNFLHNLQTDVFLPCGGRPMSLNDYNWKSFLIEEKPSSNLIIEGANLYLSDFARQKLEEKGVTIIKDSSANKCGVICSSYEILAGLLLDEKTFLSIKKRFISQVLIKLKNKAIKEAQLLLNSPDDQSTTELSEIISSKINNFTDIIFEDLQQENYSKTFYNKLKESVIQQHMPPILITKFKAAINRLPKIYIDAIMASQIASSLIYKKGVDYQPDIFDTLDVEIKKGLLK